MSSICSVLTSVYLFTLPNNHFESNFELLYAVHFIQLCVERKMAFLEQKFYWLELLARLPSLWLLNKTVKTK